MSISVKDISAKLLTYLLGKTAITDEVGQRIFSGGFPTVKTTKADNQANPKITFRQNGGDPKGLDYRYTFIVRADTLIKAREIGILVTNSLVEENFSIEDDSNNNLSYWAESDGGINDTLDDDTGNPEVMFNINFLSI